MSSIVHDNSFKTLSPFIDALVNKIRRRSPRIMFDIDAAYIGDAGVVCQFVLEIHLLLLHLTELKYRSGLRESDIIQNSDLHWRHLC